MASTQLKTPEEIEQLKQSWLADPCWDIYTTDGFECHEFELMQFQAEWEGRWEANRRAALEQKAASLGVPGNLDLARYLERLEMKIESLSEELERRS